MLLSVLSSAGDLYHTLANNTAVNLVVRTVVVGAISYYGVKWIANALDPTSKQKERAKKQAEVLMRKMGIEGVSLTDYEMKIATHLIDPKSMTESWQDIAGLDEIIEELQDNVILPIQHQDLLPGSKLFKPPKGVLLCGPPGCGKTTIARAVAKASGCHFINLQPSSLTHKWQGESQKLTAAVFSLAAKLQPCIIFIDDINSFIWNRSSQDAETTAMVKAQLWSLWDGLQGSGQVIVLGATNRPHDIDPVFLRRMPTAFHIGLPNTTQRHKILQLMLAGENVSGSINLKEIVEQTEGFSGSDLQEICRNAVIHRVHSHMQKMKQRSQESPVEQECQQPISQEDLLLGLSKLKASKQVASSDIMLSCGNEDTD